MTIEEMIDGACEEVYEEAKSEYNDLPSAEKDEHAFYGSCIVHMEAKLAGRLGRKIAMVCATKLDNRFEDERHPDHDLLCKDN